MTNLLGDGINPVAQRIPVPVVVKTAEQINVERLHALDNTTAKVEHLRKTVLAGKVMTGISASVLGIAAIAAAILNPLSIAAISTYIPAIGALAPLWGIIMSNPIIWGILLAFLALMLITLIVGAVLLSKQRQLEPGLFDALKQVQQTRKEFPNAIPEDRVKKNEVINFITKANPYLDKLANSYKETDARKAQIQNDKNILVELNASLQPDAGEQFANGFQNAGNAVSGFFTQTLPGLFKGSK